MKKEIEKRRRKDCPLRYAVLEHPCGGLSSILLLLDLEWDSVPLSRARPNSRIPNSARLLLVPRQVPHQQGPSFPLSREGFRFKFVLGGLRGGYSLFPPIRKGRPRVAPSRWTPPLSLPADGLFAAAWGKPQRTPLRHWEAAYPAGILLLHLRYLFHLHNPKKNSNC